MNIEELDQLSTKKLLNVLRDTEMLLAQLVAETRYRLVKSEELNDILTDELDITHKG